MDELYKQNCLRMIRINRAMIEETEEKIRLALRHLAARGEAEPKDRAELERLNMELDGWIEWVKRWETRLAEATGDGS